jgi:hypothetical protein
MKKQKRISGILVILVTKFQRLVYIIQLQHPQIHALKDTL